MKIYLYTKRLLQLLLLWHMLYVVVVVIDKRLPLGYPRKKNVHKFFFWGFRCNFTFEQMLDVFNSSLFYEYQVFVWIISKSRPFVHLSKFEISVGAHEVQSSYSSANIALTFETCNISFSEFLKNPCASSEYIHCIQTVQLSGCCNILIGKGELLGCKF